jgi:hypothetical protein
VTGRRYELAYLPIEFASQSIQGLFGPALDRRGVATPVALSQPWWILTPALAALSVMCFFGFSRKVLVKW